MDPGYRRGGVRGVVLGLGVEVIEASHTTSRWQLIITEDNIASRRMGVDEAIGGPMYSATV